MGADGAGVEFELYTISELLARSRSRLDDPVSLPGARRVVGESARCPDRHRDRAGPGANCSFEPYWPYLARLLEWAADHVPTTLLSVPRRAREHSPVRWHRSRRAAGQVQRRVRGSRGGPSRPATIGLPIWSDPHSRSTTCRSGAVDAGYRSSWEPAPRGPAGRWRAREHRDGLFVLCQGHPEYGTLSLLREYRRDVRRCLFGRGAVPYPRLPDGYLGQEAVATN